MRYVAKKDVVIEYNGEETLVLEGETVFFKEHAGSWKIFSFLTRKLLGAFTKAAAQKHFYPEAGGPPAAPRRYIPPLTMWVIFMLLIPLGALTQTPEPVKWTGAAIRIAQNIYQLQLEAEIDPEWWIYHPNAENMCVQPTTVRILSDSTQVKQLDDFNVISRWKDFDRRCKADRYYDMAMIVCSIKVNDPKNTIIKVNLTYQPTARYGPWDIRTINFYIPTNTEKPTKGRDSALWAASVAHFTNRVSEEGGRILTTPKTTIGKIWWRIRHPFKKPFWNY